VTRRFAALQIGVVYTNLVARELCKIGRMNVVKRMRKASLVRQCQALVAVLAFAFNAFTPAISHAMLAQSGKTLVEICTAQGSAWVEVPSDNGAPESQATHDCAICLAASAPPAPIPTQASILIASASPFIVRLSAGTTRFASAIRPHAPSTGPPSL